MKPAPIRALIWDFDGLIVDTETPVYESWRSIYLSHGHDLPLETYVRCVGATTRQFDPISHLQDLTGANHDDEQTLSQMHRVEVHQRLASADALPGVRDRLDEARSSGLRVGLASSSPSEWIFPWLDRLGLTHHFPTVRTRDMVRRAKPDPELFLTAAAELGVVPEEALVVEDSHNGLLAARAAGMRCLIIPNGITGASDFAAASLVLSSLAEKTLAEILTLV